MQINTATITILVSVVSLIVSIITLYVAHLRGPNIALAIPGGIRVVLLCAQFPRFRHPYDGGALPEVRCNPDELIRQIKAFQHVRATGGLTPSGWQPGQVTLKPGPALVGKVGQV